MHTNIYSYIRVSTRDQNEDRQFIAMNELAIPEKNISMDKQSGKDFDRPQYKNGQMAETGQFILHQEHRPTGAQL